jgi:hypothetical protein
MRASTLYVDPVEHDRRIAADQAEVVGQRPLRPSVCRSGVGTQHDIGHVSQALGATS